MSRENNQRGGIVLFAIVGVVLAGLLAGALYVGKQRADIAKENTPKPIAIDTEKEATDKNKAATTTQKKTTNTKPAQSSTSSSSPQPHTSGASTSTPSTSSSSTSRSSSVASTGPSQVASTGPADTLFTVVIVSAITFVGFVFVQSNFQLRRSALNR